MVSTGDELLDLLQGMENPQPADSVQPAADSVQSAADSVQSAADSIQSAADSVHSTADTASEQERQRYQKIQECLMKLKRESRSESRSRTPPRWPHTSATSSQIVQATSGQAKAPFGQKHEFLPQNILIEMARSFQTQMKEIADMPGISTEHFLQEMVDFETEDGYSDLRNHALQKVHLLVEEEQPGLFYIGICCNVKRRWLGSKIPDLEYKGHCETWQHMDLLCWADGPTIALLEKAVLNKYVNHRRCKNKAEGGQRPGPLGVCSFLYMCRDLCIE